jgi:CubicO group peptidase (beta-lactamase class C family)
MSRREFAGCTARLLLASAIPAVCLPVPAYAQESDPPPKPADAELEAITEIVSHFMDKYHVPGLSLAIARQGQMVHRQGFGYADEEAAQRVTPEHLFRIASVSKPITSVALFTLIEQGRLKLADHVFGAGGVLGCDYAETYPERVSKITVHHLLTHTGGGWGNDGSDPMFRNTSMGHRELIAWAIQKQPLKHEPGENYAYSNFGYCILGRVVEKVSGQSYSSFVQQAVLKPCGITDMQLAGNTLAQKAPNEVRYYGRSENPYRMNVTRMDAHGGWIATPADLVRFAVRVGGYKGTPSLLRPETIKTMMTASTANENYACGWCVNRVPNYWHNGSLPGTSTLMVRTASGLCWAVLANARGQGINPALDQMMGAVAKAVPAWRA